MRYIVFDRYGREIARDMWPRKPLDGFLRVLCLFDKDDILFEIQQLAAAQGESARIKDDATGALIEQFKNICAEENLDRPLRTIPLAMSKCERILHNWVQRTIDKHTAIKNDMDERKELSLELKVEEHFTSELAWSVMRHVQEYIEAYVLEDWAGVTYPEGRKYWTERCILIEDELKKLTEYMDDDCRAFIPPFC